MQELRAMPGQPDDEQQDSKEDDEGINDPLTRSDVEAPRMRSAPVQTQTSNPPAAPGPGDKSVGG